MRLGVVKHRIKGVEITNWKVGDADAFEAIAPAWTDEELDIGPTNAECCDAEQEHVQLSHKNNKTNKE